NRSAEPGSLAVRIGFDDRTEGLAAAPDVYYVTDHYLNYSGVLDRLSHVTPDVLKDTFGDKRELFLRALATYVTESVQSINAELEKPGSPLSAVRNALVTFAERNHLSSSEGCMGVNAICEFGQRDS